MLLPNSILQSTGPIDFIGADGSLGAYILQALLQKDGNVSHAGGLAVLVTPTPETARRLSQWLSFFSQWFQGGDVLSFPDIEWSPYGEYSPERGLIMRRLSALFRLKEGPKPKIVIVPATALLRRVLPRTDLASRSELILKESELDRDTFAKLLVSAGYLSVPVVEDPGTFHLRGGMIDVYPPLSANPARIELYGDLVETIRLFDPKTQRTTQEVQELLIGPVREERFTPEGIAKAKATLRAVADEINLPSIRTRLAIEEIERGIPFFGVESLSPAYHDPWESLFAYFGEKVRYIIEDPAQVKRALLLAEKHEEDAFLNKRAKGEICLPYESHFITTEEIFETLEKGPLWRMRQVSIQSQGEALWDEAGLPIQQDEVNALQGVSEIGKEAKETYTFQAQNNADLAKELERLHGLQEEQSLGPLQKRIAQLGADGAAIGLVAATAGAAERFAAVTRASGVISQVLRDTKDAEKLLSKNETITPRPSSAQIPKSDLPIGPLQYIDPARPAVFVLVGELERGFVIPGVLALITEEEIFGQKAKRRPTSYKKSDPFSTQLGDLEIGDLVVHTDFGVGKYLGLMRQVVNNREGDYLVIEYAEKNKLYLPVHRLGRVQKYVGGENANIQIDKLGGTGWEKVKRKVSKAAREMAEELLKLYAQRQLAKAKKMPEPDGNYRSFEATFNFTETPDQQQAIDAVIQDLCKPTPMDRLVCGDVGYGKTEVALRAAFHTAFNGGQVAVLVPTTVLAQQHFLNFKSRMQSWPLRVEVLSRFVSTAEQKKIVKDTAEGKVDILIGTHRVLSQDLNFRALELLIIDEEQRFGVVHKERLKKLKNQVHVLTMSATPIPRTLHMAMMGIRDLSIIATAPTDRLSVRTFVARTTDEVIRDAIQRELNRGGQVFFVHNRVQTIGQVFDHLKRLVPSARIVVGHGQMGEGELEKVMYEFVQGAYDILLCTTIIESGLDIPRANTILLNRADTFGLSQIYQLRGRVGRSKERGYCHLLVPGENAMTEEAKERLSVLQRFTELGAGFQIASHDLEIRGAGNMLGDNQSGHVASVGFELYTELLAEAIAELKGEDYQPQNDPELNIDVDLIIPEDFVDDVHERLKLYRRLSRALNLEELEEISLEMVDRFGQLPKATEQLIQAMELQKILRQMNAVSLELSGSRMVVGLGQAPKLMPEKIFALIKLPNSPYKLSPDLRLTQYLEIPKEATDPERLATARRALEALREKAKP
jgi:transcription-repair coupling factor (superfamily II helicase)